MSALMTALREGGIDAALTYLEAVLGERDELRHKVADHDRRVTELLEANNREVERRRLAERELALMKGHLSMPHFVITLPDLEPAVEVDSFIDRLRSSIGRGARRFKL